MSVETKWIEPDFNAEVFILAGDIGGTNANFGIVGKRGRSFRTLAKFQFKTQKLSSPAEAVEAVLLEISNRRPGLSIDLCCISAAGPVAGNRCSMTNAPWEIRGSEIEAALGARTIIINDFMALSYALPLLDTSDPSQLTVFPHTDGSRPSPSGYVRAVVGAGTGLGAGFLIEDHGRYIACPSEGGHMDFGGFDQESRELASYIAEKFSTIPEAELFVSGQGIVNIVRFLAGRSPENGGPKVPLSIADAEAGDIPALVSAAAAAGDPFCSRAVKLFVKMYARFAANAAVTFLPSAGLFIAGGIAAKNEKFFLEDDLFMKTFEIHYRESIRKALQATPVYMVKDYGISLLGAANAAYSLL